MSTPGQHPAVLAAGGVVVRGDTPAEAEVAVVHRPRYDDWTLPKGKLDPGEGRMACAVREVHEETGYLCRAVGPAGTSRYSVEAGWKEVEYYAMRPIRHSGFEPNDEIDEVRWMSIEDASELLTYGFDRDLLSSVDLDSLLSQREVHIVRHGVAGDRSGWDGPDSDRPLSDKGDAQALALAEQMTGLGIDRILSSPYLRCVQTVQPLADKLGLAVEQVEALAEGPDAGLVEALLDDVARSRAVLCSHGDVIPVSLEQLEGRGARLRSPRECRKGSTWVVGHDGVGYTDAFYLPPPT